MRHITLDLAAALHSAQDIARRAGAVLRDAYHRPRHIGYKGEVDLVTWADVESERLIVAELREAFPEHTILAEEGGVTSRNDDSEYTWVVDPLDGTTNFAHGVPIFAVSIALRGPDGNLLLGVVYDPMRNECFAATRGGGTTLNGTPIRVTEEAELGRALLVTGFAYERRTATDGNFAVFTRFVHRTQGLLRLGTAAINLAYVACGRLDGFWAQGLYPWDVAAGILLVREAGGMVTNYTGSDEGLYEGRHIVASNGHLHKTVLAVLAEE